MPDDVTTLVSLRDYIERIIAEHCKANAAEFDSMQSAIRVATTALEMRLAAMNEFRAALENQNRTFVTRDLMDANMGQLRKDTIDLRDMIRVAEIKQSNLDGRLAAYGVALFLVITLVNIGLRFLP